MHKAETAEAVEQEKNKADESESMKSLAHSKVVGH